MSNQSNDWYCRVCFKNHEPSTEFKHYIDAIRFYGLTDKQRSNLMRHGIVSSDPVIHELLSQIEYLESCIESLESIIEKI